VARAGERPGILGSVAEAALLSGDSASARAYAERAVQAKTPGWAVGLLTHRGHAVLGALEYDAGNTRQAVRHLELSMPLESSPQFQVRGPSPHLLRRLRGTSEDARVDAFVTRWEARFGLPEGWTLPR
jgi:hypothetical protein